MEKFGKIYHFKPKDLRGDSLEPLNVLKEKYPDLYKTEISKYTGRENLVNQEISPLKASWGDVIHLSAVHPEKIKEALVKAGHKGNINFDHLEIDPSSLDPNNTTVYLNNKDKIEDKDFIQYNPAEVALYSELPEETKEHYRQMISSGRDPFLYHRVPHILHKGSIKVK